MIPSPASIVPPGFASHALKLLQKVQHGKSPIELVYSAHEHWPFLPGKSVHARPTLRISVLDSSFNPPTLAHLALANALPPSFQAHSSAARGPAEPYDARILLLSVRNADKALKQGDATFVQRLEMMLLLSHDVSGGEPSQPNNNVAIAIIDEPTFVGKSTVLLRFLETKLAPFVEPFASPDGMRDVQSYQIPAPKLDFLMGFDTLSRFLSPKYYPSRQDMVRMLRTFHSPDQEDCRIVCAYRRSASGDEGSHRTQDKTLEVAREFMTSGRIAFIDIGAEEQTYSSSDVRTRVASGDESWRRLVTGTLACYIIKQKLYSSLEREQQ